MDNIIFENDIEKINALADENFSYERIIENLKDDSSDDFVKIFSIINLSEIKSENDFEVVIKHLTNHPTPIREALALQLENSSSLYEKYFIKHKEQILAAVIDINPNVSRAVCSILDKCPLLQKEIEEDIISRIENLLKDIKNSEISGLESFVNSTKNRKNHAKNKKLFALYWLLEALSVLISDRFLCKVTEILRITLEFSDYTIREKTAKILMKMPDAPDELFSKVALDQNFYVKNQVCDKISFEDFN